MGLLLLLLQEYWRPLAAAVAPAAAVPSTAAPADPFPAGQVKTDTTVSRCLAIITSKGT
jgi:hypothetical protein